MAEMDGAHLQAVTQALDWCHRWAEGFLSVARW